MTLRVRLLAGIVTGVLLVGGCSGDDGDADDAQATTTTAAADATREQTVELLDAGAAPRVALRLAAKAGTQQRIRLRQEVRQRVTTGGRTREIDSPTTEFDARYRVAKVAGDRITLDVAYEDARVVGGPGADPAVIDQLVKVVDALVGETAQQVTDTKGRIYSIRPPTVDFDGQRSELLDQFLDGLREQASSLAFPFPEEPLGVGARWRVTSSALLAGLRINSVAEITLSEVKGPNVAGRLTNAITFVPGPTEIAGTTATVVSGRLNGQGTIRWDLNSVMPLLEQTTEGLSVISIGDGANAQRIEQFQRQVMSTRLR